MKKSRFAFLCAVILFSLFFLFHENQSKAQELSYEVVSVYPHDTTSFTQGLVWYEDVLYEGTGLYGSSKLAKVDLLSGKALMQYSLDKNYFGEGITVFENRIYQLTWKEHKIYVYDYLSFIKIDEYEWPLEGWGITHDEEYIIISTGSDKLYFLDPHAMNVIKEINVNNNGKKVFRINELEYVDGFIYANQYLTNNILKINAGSGKVEGVLDLKDIFARGNKPYEIYDNEDVLNGIAYNATKNTFYITGKRWKYLFEIKIFKEAS